MKKIIALSTLLVLGVTFSSCKKKEVATETITYQVTLSNPNRTATVYYINETGGQDQVELTTANFTKEIEIKTDKTKSTFSLSVYCGSKYTAGVYEPQTISMKILEGETEKQTKTISGSSSIYSYDNQISASLPTAVKYK